MKKVLLILMTLCLFSCTNISITKRIESDVIEYKKCNNQAEFKEWLFRIGSEGTTIVEDGITYNIHRTYDPINSIVRICVYVEDGVADYYQYDFSSELKEKFKQVLKNHSVVKCINTSYGCSVEIVLNNDKGFNNAD